MEIIALLAQVEAKKARDVSASDVDAHDGVGHPPLSPCADKR